MASYFLSGNARSDLADIWRYYDEIGGEQLANQQIARLHYRFEILAEYPLIGKEHNEYAVGIRSIISPSPPYTILYYPRESQIEIAYVVHSNRDTVRLFEQSP